MSTDLDNSPPVESVQEITLMKEADSEWWVAKDEETGVASQGKSRAEALEMLDEAVALHRGEIGEPIDDEDEFLREIGIDPEEIPAEPKEKPEFLQ